MSGTSVLLTGGAGFIGSHTYIALKRAGFKPVLVDNFTNSDRRVLSRLAEITGDTVDYYEADVLDTIRLTEVFSACDVSAVLHFAGLKAVGESVKNPLRYYRNNVVGTITLLEVMAKVGVRSLVFLHLQPSTGTQTKARLARKDDCPQQIHMETPSFLLKK